MKNREFYKTVSKTGLLKIFEKNKVMSNTYFGRLDYLFDFTNEEVYNKLLKATPWRASEDHTDLTIYRADKQFNLWLTDEGTMLTAIGTTSTDQYGLTVTTSPDLGNKFMVELNLTLYWDVSTIPATKQDLLNIYLGNGEGQHTRITAISKKDALGAVAVELYVTNPDTRSVIFRGPWNIKRSELTKLQLIYDLDNETVQFVVNGASFEPVEFYGGKTDYVQIEGTAVADYKTKTTLLLNSIELKDM